jgi:hypothetical protein
MPESPGSRAPNPLPRIRDSDWVVGELLAHGEANYRFDELASRSYFIRLRTQENEQGARRRTEEADRGDRWIDGREERRPWSPDDGGVRILWGTDLRRAIAESKSQVKVGQIVAARVVKRERLYFESPGKEAGNGQSNPYRNRWEVETPQFVAQRQKFARAVNENYQGARRRGVDDPESFALYLIHDGARRLAEQRFANAEDQQKFLARVRAFFAASPEREALIAKTVERLKLERAAKSNRSDPKAPEALTRE